MAYGQRTEPSPPRALFSFLSDPRLCILLTILYALAVWRAPAIELSVLFLGLLVALIFFRPWRMLRKSAVRRLILFSLFWPLAKLVVDAAFAFWPVLTEAFFSENATALQLPGWQFFWRPALTEAGLLFLRLLTLLAVSWLLLLVATPRELGFALNWAFFPVSRKNSWQIALALAFMGQYLLFLPAAFEQTTLGAESRKLPGYSEHAKTGGKVPAVLQKYSTLVSQVSRYLFLRAEAQATAAVTRKLDNADAWKKSYTLRPADLLTTAVAALPALYCLFN